MIIMKKNEFAAKLIDCAKNYKSLYVHGCFGAPMTDKNKKRWIKEYPYNQKPAREKKIMAASADTFGFDCINLVKAILWGWCGDVNAEYGGAKYESHDVPDVETSQMLRLCYDVSTDFSKIEVGEYLYMTGHCGVYVGNGLAVECTPKWEDGVQITACNRSKDGYNRRDWSKHAKFPWIDYKDEEQFCEVELPLLKKGAKNASVKSMQTLLAVKGYVLGPCGIDGDFGSATEKAVKAFQEKHKLEIDGEVGPITWKELISGGGK